MTPWVEMRRAAKALSNWKMFYLRFSSRPFHGVGFSSPSLSVRKNGAVEAIQDLVDNRDDSLVVEVSLPWLRPKDLSDGQNRSEQGKNATLGLGTE